MSSKYLLCTSCAISGLVMSGGALAQTVETSPNNGTEAEAKNTAEAGDSAEDDKVVVEERQIIVTGTRFQELLDKPQPKAIISAEDRNLAGVNSAAELIRAQPGFYITSDFGVNARGVGRQTAQTLLGQENTVIQYVDNFINLVPENIAESTLFGGNVTFVRGPAGTTYGRNAIAGAVNLLSRAPTAEFTAQAVAGTGRAGAYNFGINLSGPITDNLGFRVGMQRFKAPSIFRAVGGQKGAGFATDNTYFEFQLDWNIGNLHVRNRATTFSYDNQPGYPTLSRYNNGLNGNTTGIFGDLSPNPAFGFTGAVPSEPYTTNVNVAGYDRLRGNFQNVLNADLDLGFATLFYTGGYQQYKASGEADRDLTSRTSYDGNTLAPGTFAPGTQVPTDYRTNYFNDNYFWSQELRLVGNGDKLDWVVGAYYFNQDFDEQYWENIVNATDQILAPIVGTPGLTLAPNPRRSTYEQRNLYEIRSTAFFGNITYDFTPELRFDGGLRYTMDEKEALTNFRFIFYYPPFFAGDFSPLVHSANPMRDDNGLSGRAAIAWRPNPGDQLYLSYARGYQSSAFTLGQGVPGPDPAEPRNIADKEFLDVYEIGGNLTRGRVRFDGSIFYQLFHDQQIPISTRGTFVGPGGPAPGPVFTRFENAKKTEIYGAEALVSWRPTDYSNIVASYTYLHGEFKDFCPTIPNSTTCGVVDIFEPAALQTPEDLSGNVLPRAPKHKASIYGYYGIDMGGAGRLYPGGSVYYQSSFYTSPFSKANRKVPGRTVVNATLTYRTADERLDLTAVVSNLFKKRYADSSVLNTFGTGLVSQSVFYGADRYWSLTARYRF